MQLSDLIRLIKAVPVDARPKVLALARSRERDSAQQLEEALDKSRVISTAVGILMGSLGLTNEQAMDLMRRASQRLNRKVSDLAETVNYTGELPP